MSGRIRRPYGLWASPISPEMLAGDVRLTDVAWDDDGRTLVWREERSDRGVLVAAGLGEAPRDLTRELSVRAQVGYGGGEFAVRRGWVYFVAHPSGQLYRQALAGGAAQAITPPFGRAAAPTVSPDGRHVAYVHADDAGTDRIAVVDAAGEHWPRILAAGHDFFMQPRWSPDGSRLAFVAWDHPRMPWDGTRLYLAPVLYERVGPPRLGPPAEIAGADDVAVCQPEFAPDGQSILFVSDEPGWGHLQRLDLAAVSARPLTAGEAEHGQPAWGQGMRSYGLTADGRTAYLVRGERGFRRLVRLDMASGDVTPVPSLADYTDVDQLAAAPAGDRLALIATGSTIPPRLVVLDGATGDVRIVARAAGETVPASDLSVPEAVSWPTAGGEVAHGLFYPPAGAGFESPGRPPLVVVVHGGPTSQARARWDPAAQYLATRGWAVLQLNYRGSTGYGRAYMLRLRASWGVCDVEDAISAVGWLGQSGRIDPERAVIMGGSAGGFTVLQTMVEAPEVFRAGISLYGVADQFHLARETHKFESRYSDSLLGPLPEAAAVYRARSPLCHADRIRRPLAVFQGADDRVVPRAQSDAIVAALRQSGTPHVYHVYDGEGHGWRRRETIAHFWRAVEAFLQEHVLFA